VTVSNLNRRGLEIWDSTHVDTGDGDFELRPELREILDAHREPCGCAVYSRRHTVGSHLFTEAFVAHAPDLTEDQIARLRVLFGR
jgi:hypothetical protein